MISLFSSSCSPDSLMSKEGYSVGIEDTDVVEVERGALDVSVIIVIQI